VRTKQQPLFLLPYPTNNESTPAAFTTTAAIAKRAALSSSQFTPITGPDALKKLVARFTNDILNTTDITNKCNINDFVSKNAARLERNGLRPDDGRMSSVTGHHMVVVKNRPPFDNMYFFLDPHTVNEPKGPTCFSVMSVAQADIMRNKGFMELNFTHLSQEDFSLPMCTTTTNGTIVNDTNGNMLTQTTAQLSLVPLSSDTLDCTNIVIPNIPATLSKINQSSSAKSAAVQVMSMVEDDFLMDGILYSSMSSWTKNFRSKMNWTKSTKQEFIRRMKMYVYIVNCDSLPLEKYGALRKASDIWAIKMRSVGAAAKSEGGIIDLHKSPDDCREGVMEKTTDWFQMTQSLVKEKKNMSLQTIL
jgi:hypothetical protein